jgi:hypothetical protein
MAKKETAENEEVKMDNTSNEESQTETVESTSDSQEENTEV